MTAAAEPSYDEVVAMLQDAGHEAAGPVLEQLRAIEALDAPEASLPALRARVLLHRLDADGRGHLLGDLLAVALVALHSHHVEADAALALYEGTRQAVQRSEVRAAAQAKVALEHRCEHCIRDAWWRVEAFSRTTGQLRLVGEQASCRLHVDDVARDLAERAEDAGVRCLMLPGHPDYLRDPAPSAVTVPPPAAQRTASEAG